jgi:transposase
MLLRVFTTGASLMPHSDKQQYWQAHINAWQRSGLSQAAYCQAKQLSLASFGYWRKRCSDSSASASLPAVIPVLRESASVGTQLRSPGGWQILLPVDLDAAVLCKLLTRLP